VRDAHRARASLAKYGIALPDARITTSYGRYSPRLERGHRVDRDAEPLARGGGRGGGAGGKHMLLEKPTGSDRRRARAHSRRGGGEPAYGRSSLSSLRYNPF